jgi:S1-C subfamily serine protease
VKPSVVAVGTFQKTRSPAFQFMGTGFAVGDGSIIATNAHVVPAALDPAKGEMLAILLPAATKEGKDQVALREVRRIAIDPSTDLALLKLMGAPLAPLVLGDSERAQEGEQVLFTGFPIGAVLGPFPVTHRGMISAITPIAIPQGRAGDLDAATIRRLTSGVFEVLQLDATAYPGNSGSPLYDPQTGEVLGVINMVLVKSTKESVLAQPSGITYAVPAVHLKRLLERTQ